MSTLDYQHLRFGIGPENLFSCCGLAMPDRSRREKWNGPEFASGQRAYAAQLEALIGQATPASSGSSTVCRFSAETANTGNLRLAIFLFEGGVAFVMFRRRDVAGAIGG